MLQAITEPFRNDLVGMRNRAVEMRIGLGTLLVPIEIQFYKKRNKQT